MLAGPAPVHAGQRFWVHAGRRGRRRSRLRRDGRRRSSHRGRRPRRRRQTLEPARDPCGERVGPSEEVGHTGAAVGGGRVRDPDFDPGSVAALREQRTPAVAVAHSIGVRGGVDRAHLTARVKRRSSVRGLRGTEARRLNHRHAPLESIRDGVRQRQTPAGELRRCSRRQRRCISRVTRQRHRRRGRRGAEHQQRGVTIIRPRVIGRIDDRARDRADLPGWAGPVRAAGDHGVARRLIGDPRVGIQRAVACGQNELGRDDRRGAHGEIAGVGILVDDERHHPERPGRGGHAAQDERVLRSAEDAQRPGARLRRRRRRPSGAQRQCHQHPRTDANQSPHPCPYLRGSVLGLVVLALGCTGAVQKSGRSSHPRQRPVTHRCQGAHTVQSVVTHAVAPCDGRQPRSARALTRQIARRPIAGGASWITRHADTSDRATRQPGACDLWCQWMVRAGIPLTSDGPPGHRHARPRSAPGSRRSRSTRGRRPPPGEAPRR